MAATPGFLTDWPWAPLGSFKYLVLAPWALHSIYSHFTKEESHGGMTIYVLTLPFLLSRAFQNLIWISFSRHRTATGKTRIVDKNIEFDQIDRESNWDDHIIFNGIIFYLFALVAPVDLKMPWWRMDGVVIAALLHVGPVEFLYYWLHRALHHHFLYSRYHSHHHSSIATEPITSVIHPFAEHISYYMLFSIPFMTTVHTGTASVVSVFGYVTFLDLMNNMGHCNFELIPKKLFSIFPPLKYILYTPSYHSLHHTQFRTNYSLFMPIYDYIYGTMDKSTDSLYETSLEKQEDEPDVVHLTHLTTPESIYQIRVGFANVASNPLISSSSWYTFLMSPITICSMIITSIYGRTFIIERNVLENLKMQTRVIPRYTYQYFRPKWQVGAINGLIEKTILDAEEKGAKVVSLGLLNQGEELNRNGELFVQKYPKLRVKVVDGSSLAVAIILNTVPEGTKNVVLSGKFLTKVAYSIVSALCKKGIQVNVPEHDYDKLKLHVGSDQSCNLVFSKYIAAEYKVWLMGDGVTEEEQHKAQKGTIFIPFGLFPPRNVRSDCYYMHTPAMLAPPSLQNIDSCENWLPRRAVSAARVAGMVHALEGWNVNECGETMMDVHKVWEAALSHGFKLLGYPSKPGFSA